MELSIYETGMPPHFRLTGGHFDWATAITTRPDGSREPFTFVEAGAFWQSAQAIPNRMVST